MKIYSNYYTNNLQFYGHRIKYTNEQLSNVLDPLFEQKLPFNEIMSISGFSYNVINKWAKDTKGMTANQLYRKNINEREYDKALENKLKELRTVGCTCKEIAKNFNHSLSWVSNKLKKFNIEKQLTVLQLKLQENVPRMIQDGYTIDAMAKELGCGPTYVSDWIVKIYGKNIKQIRHDNNPEGAITKLQKRMKENIPRMVENGYTIDAMAKELGCGPTYVSDWIFKTYGKHLKQIRCENNIRIKIHP